MYLLLIASILFASCNSILLHRLRLPSAAAVYRLNLVSALVWLTCLLTLNGFRITPSRTSLLFGLVYGVTQALFILFKSLAMNRGPISVTALFGNGSLFLSVAVCYFAFGEPITLGDAIGLLLLFAAILLSTYKRTAGGDEAPRRGWLLFSLLFLALGAGVGISFKAFAGADGGSAGDMMCIAAAVMVLFFLPLYLAARGKAGRSMGEDMRRFIPLAVASGLLSCLYNRLNISLSGALAATIFFPFFNGGVILLTALCGVALTREKLTLRKATGLLLGILAIAVIGVF